MWKIGLADIIVPIIIIHVFISWLYDWIIHLQKKTFLSKFMAANNTTDNDVLGKC